jgi:predicted phosphodiesterase
MRLGVLGGIHEDVIRLTQAFELLDHAGCETIACLGDIVGYSVPYYGFLKSRDARRAVQLVRERCEHVVTGNHDLFAIRKIPLHQHVFAYPANWYALDWVTRRKLSRGRVWLYDDELPALLGPEDEAYLGMLPEFLTIELDGIRLMLSHYAYPDLVGDAVSFDAALPENLSRHVDFMREHGCAVGFSCHDGDNGMTLHVGPQQVKVGFGTYSLPQEQPVWIQCPWVANGTYANGVLVLDTIHRQIRAIPLHSPPHIVPSWAER